MTTQEATKLIKELYYEEDYCLVPELAEALDLAIKALEIADKLEQAEAELKDEYNRINDWYMNKFDLNAEHTDLEIEALHFTGMIQQTISYLLDSLADIRGNAQC